MCAGIEEKAQVTACSFCRIETEYESLLSGSKNLGGM